MRYYKTQSNTKEIRKWFDNQEKCEYIKYIQRENKTLVLSCKKTNELCKIHLCPKNNKI